MEEDNFNADWLNERYPYDAEGRNKIVETAALDYLKDKTTLNLVDIGAGTGSNCLYLMDKLDQDQVWTFIEQDAALNPILEKRLKDYAAYHKYQWEESGTGYHIQAPSKKLTFQIRNASLLDLPDLVDLSKVDLLLANAVFDLFAYEQLERFLQSILQYHIPCLFTMNYQTMVYTPEDPFDQSYISLYEAHMERTQDFGQAMGKQAGKILTTWFKQANWEVTQGEGDWHLLEDDIKMHYYLLNFMDVALEELDFDGNLKAQFPKWLQRKKDLIITRRQQLRIGHLDLFVKKNE